MVNSMTFKNSTEMSSLCELCLVFSVTINLVFLLLYYYRSRIRKIKGEKLNKYIQTNHRHEEEKFRITICTNFPFHVNKIIEDIWKTDPLSFETIIQQKLKQLVPKVCTIQNVKIGNKPFRVQDIETSNKNGEFIVDAQIFYKGDAELGFHAALLDGAIKNFYFVGKLRFTFQPKHQRLIVTCIGKPSIDFNIVGYGSLFEEWIKGKIKEIAFKVFSKPLLKIKFSV